MKYIPFKFMYSCESLIPVLYAKSVVAIDESNTSLHFRTGIQGL